ncbi:MoaD/ThiS family protein [Pyrococcus yayanosii]|uniref:ThiS family, putative n=1 Tax=Pyrococcus yayanosii (strain CH1 / JCM 16557) TaxID=529709 RepID=F8AIK9_PYRYC|nr:MoaD/ThiS family protein [Pyrococcus yayanosii]AEH24375.1 ThiS family, putative [Pyrococcus yayanosii CH1]
MKVVLILYGELALKFSPRSEVEVEEGTTIGELLRKLGISAEEHHILVNEKKVSEDHVLKEGDIVKLLPVVFGG